MWQSSYDGSPTLFLVPTPIGNLEDITLRALNVLKEADVIFSEDTRQTAMLLSYYDIKSKLICLEDHNENIVKEKVVSYLQEGKSVAIVTDRGTPIISDPGYKSVKYVTDLGFNVVSLPGATAFVPALTSSSLEPLPFLFYGFLNSKDQKRKNELFGLKDFPYTIIFYESPHRIEKTLKDMLDIFGNRSVSISREISKKFESVYRGNLENVIVNLGTVKGEYVIVVAKEENGNDNDIDYVNLINNYVSKGFLVSDAIKMVAKENNVNKNKLYKEYHGGRQ